MFARKLAPNRDWKVCYFFGNFMPGKSTVVSGMRLIPTGTLLATGYPPICKGLARRMSRNTIFQLLLIILSYF